MKITLYMVLFLALICGTVALYAQDEQEADTSTTEQSVAPSAPAVKIFKVDAYCYSFSPNVITVKKGDNVKILATALDVAHGFSIKEYGIDEKLEKGITKTIEFTADQAGTFDIVCDVYCGPGHADMKATLVVEE